MAEHLSQAARRRWVQLPDQHGRAFETVIDVVGGAPCAPINPRGWNAPLTPPQKYIKFSGEMGQYKVIIDYPKWIDDLQAAHKVYEQKLFDDALVIFGATGTKAYADRDPALLRYTGPGPQFVEPVIAASQGNKWVLGLTDKPDGRLTRFFQKPAEEVIDYSTDYTDEEVEAEPEPVPAARPRNEKGTFVKTGG
jgi:hypothetical protein